jgi:hypothetical protein
LSLFFSLVSLLSQGLVAVLASDCPIPDHGRSERRLTCGLLVVAVVVAADAGAELPDDYNHVEFYELNIHEF